MYSVCMPAFIADRTDVDDIRHEMRRTWKAHAQNINAPILILGMRDSTKKLEELKADNIFVFQSDKGFHHLLAHEILNEITRRVGIDRVLIVDDDFIVNANFSELDEQLVNQREKCLLVSTRRLWFTALRNKPTISGYIQYQSPTSKLIPQGTKPWEHYGDVEEVAGALWTREGIFIDVNDFSDAVNRRLELFPQAMADRFMLSGIDVLVLNKIASEEGLLIKSTNTHFHNTFREDAKEGELNYSTCFKSYGDKDRDIIDTPMINITRNKDLGAVLDLWDGLSDHYAYVLDSNVDEFNRLKSFIENK